MNKNDNGAITSNTYAYNWYVDPTTIPTETIPDTMYAEAINADPSIHPMQRSGPTSELIKQQICAGHIKGKVLELGCASGYFSREIAEYVDNVSMVVGCDIHQQAITTAIIETIKHDRPLCHTVLFQQIMLPDLSTIESDSFDCSVMFHTLEHLYPHDVITCLSELQRVIVSGGHCIFIVPNEHAHDCKYHHNWWNVDTFKQLFTNSGFVVEAVYVTEPEQLIAVVRNGD